MPKQKSIVVAATAASVRSFKKPRISNQKNSTTTSKSPTPSLKKQPSTSNEITNWILLLRGINVGGSGRLPMTSLKSLLSSIGCTNIDTYIQSGNAVFSSSHKINDLKTMIGDEIESHHGFRPDMFLLTKIEINQILSINPFAKEGEHNPSKMNFFFNDGSITPDEEVLRENLMPGEKFHLTPQVLFFYATEGIGKSKLARKISKFIGTNTCRNLNTCKKLINMSA